MRVLVTGISGFAGPWVARALADAGHEVHGLVRGPGPWPGLAGVPLHRGGLDEVARVVRELRPDAVVHLAAVSSMRRAEEDPAAAYRTNVGGTLDVLAAVRAHAPRARVLAVTSAEVYGAIEPANLPVAEDTPLRPLTVYGASKAAADLTAGQWARAYGLDVVRARPFNHTGRGQDPAFVCSAIARQLALIEAGRQPPV
ncbi:MAG TPA: GDP-mannose 4,6-dehydratase, partial [Candidatus Binatia bacterium]|nr:GDP-mannose 4,6-dehydratase [Candidatus Binatia bacterium]